MRLLDRYLLREFSLPWLYCLDAFALLWIVVDLFGTLDDFLEHHVPFGQVMQYYLVWFPDALVQIIPISLLLGLLFCLSNLARHNELLAMRTSGIGLMRLAAPLLAAGCVASLVVLALNELIAPAAHARARNLLRMFRGKGEENVVQNLFYVDPVRHRDWYALSYSAERRALEKPEIHERTATGTPVRDIYAERAQWIDNQWRFFGAEVHEQTPAGQVAIQRVAETNFPSLTDRPQQLLLQNKRPEDMTSGELRRIIRAHQRAGRSGQLAEYRTTLRYRYAFPWSCLLVAWIGVPLGLSTGRSGALRSVGLALGLVVAFYFISNISLALGGAGKLDPLLAAWLANLILAVAGAVLFFRLR